ncbi:hypothetical protein, partial [Methylorubrum podarium]|uniref:hypothetical protein n=1 Tax=Methylorubrum podarium TaxID=200476 RepID=UPI001EE2C5CF
AAGDAAPADGFPGSVGLPDTGPVAVAALAEGEAEGGDAEGTALLPVGPGLAGASVFASCGRLDDPVGPLPDSALLPVGPGLAGSEAIGPALVGSGFAEEALAEAAVADGSAGLPVTLESAGRDEA